VTKTIIAVALALLGASCATTAPYAEITGEGLSQSTNNEEDVLILGIDGRMDMSPGKTMMIEPGQRSVLLGTVRQDRRNRGASALVPLNAKPCLRYYFIAQHESMSLVHPWKLVLKKVEPIDDCVRQFPMHAPVPAAGAGKPAA
jgi:hypothetical protein